MFNGLDSYNNLEKYIDQLKSENITFVLRYLFVSSGFKEHFTYNEALALSNAGIRMGTVWENGKPTSANYFSTDKAKYDAEHLVSCAKNIQQPINTPIYIAVDYDANWSDVNKYLQEVFSLMKNSGYYPGIYGPGSICMKASDVLGLKYGWLSQSTGFAGYKQYKNKAQIVQGPAKKLHGVDIDTDTCPDLEKAGLWIFNSHISHTPTPSHKTLKRGDSGNEVKQLQHLLKIKEDGQFGPITEAAVKSFQTKSHLLSTGIVDSATWSKLLG